MRVLISDELAPGVMDILNREGFEVVNSPGLKPDELKNMIAGFDALIVRSATRVTSDVVSVASSLKVIGRAGTGVDNIDVPAATRRGILVMNTPGGNTVSAAEHTVSLLLALARNIPQAHMSLLKGEWARSRFTGTEVFEKTLGIIGLGKIGREVAQRCLGLGMNVIGYDPVLSPDVALKQGIEPVSLDDLYRRSDFISIHTPLTPETRGLLNVTSLAKCKRGVRVINCARGGIIDEQALLWALESGHVAGAALDVFEVEPPKDTRLVSHHRVVATPHLGASTEEAQEKVALQIASQVADALKGRGYAGLVNGAALQLALKEEIKPYVQLAERMGSIIVQLAVGKLKNVSITASGPLVVGSLELLKTGVLKGVLSHLHQDPVNFVNAPLLAADMGMVVNEIRRSDNKDFANHVAIRYETDRETREIAGTVFGTSTGRLVELDGFHLEVRPEGFLVVYNNVDRPGMLAKVSEVLARHAVNIAGVSLGRAAIGQNALTVMSIDGDIPGGGLEELGELEGVTNLRLVRPE
jgi:D-3-phosphoglycerate dehydrogenase